MAVTQRRRGLLHAHGQARQRYILLLVTLFPFWWVLRTALSSQREALATPNSLAPVGPTLINFERVLGLVNTVTANIFGHYDYRAGVSVWFRGIFRFSLHPELMVAAPIGFKLHALAAFSLFALWPFTRLVHVFSAPLGYLTRPYIVYRSRDDQLGSRAPRRGWEKVR